MWVTQLAILFLGGALHPQITHSHAGVWDDVAKEETPEINMASVLIEFFPVLFLCIRTHFQIRCIPFLWFCFHCLFHFIIIVSIPMSLTSLRILGKHDVNVGTGLHYMIIHILKLIFLLIKKNYLKYSWLANLVLISGAVCKVNQLYINVYPLFSDSFP